MNKGMNKYVVMISYGPNIHWRQCFINRMEEKKSGRMWLLSNSENEIVSNISTNVYQWFLGIYIILNHKNTIIWNVNTTLHKIEKGKVNIGIPVWYFTNMYTKGNSDKDGLYQNSVSSIIIVHARRIHTGRKNSTLQGEEIKRL